MGRFEADRQQSNPLTGECMFDNQAFSTWPLTIIGALLFGGLFALVLSLSELLLSGSFELSGGSGSLIAAAFIGYILVTKGPAHRKGAA
jgi:hypothetical protein